MMADDNPDTRNKQEKRAVPTSAPAKVDVKDRAQLPVVSEGLSSTSRKINSFAPCTSSGPGMYCASCGPLLGQYHPRLYPLIHASPFPQPRTLTKVSGRLPLMPLPALVLLMLKVPLHSKVGAFRVVQMQT